MIHRCSLAANPVGFCALSAGHSVVALALVVSTVLALRVLAFTITAGRMMWQKFSVFAVLTWKFAIAVGTSGAFAMNTRELFSRLIIFCDPTLSLANETLETGSVF
jgi:hypothetical protein